MRPGVLDTRGDPIHLVLAVELHFFELYFLQEVFRTKVGSGGEFLELCIVLGVLLGQTLIFGVCGEEYVPRAPLQHGHAFLLMTDSVGYDYRMSAR
jgi:hypothetical protein